jgi:pyrimidine operon attenuation protein / uracil phosphoribosyltransferase
MSTTPGPKAASEHAGAAADSVEAKTLLDVDAIARALSRIAHELIERNAQAPEPLAPESGLERLALVGIQTRGVPLASRLRRLVAERSGHELELGALDITFHRDDVQVRDGGRPPGRQPIVRATSVPFSLEGKTVILVDDVLYTGRTIRAAIDALLGFGRPARIQLAVLVDRGHRELPIRPDYVGKNLPTARGERIQVELVEVDELDRVLLVPEPEDETRV